MYRARIGSFRATAAALSSKLSLLDQSTLMPILMLTISNCSNSLVLAVYVYFCFKTSTRGIFLGHADYIRQSLLKKNSCPCDSLAKQSNMSFSLFKSMLLLRLGDVERNPGPPSETGLCVVHVNVRSLGKKLDLFEAESKHCDIITLSETWLSKRDNNNELHLSHFHPPVRQDRADDPHGGVAVYVRNNLYCKQRPDLHVNNLEAVWIETKLNQENLLVGLFYRPPNAKINYGNLLVTASRKRTTL